MEYQGSQGNGIGAAQVTGPERRAVAADAVGRLIEAVLSHGPGAETWYRKLLDIRDVLASPAADEDALRDAGEMFATFYRGPRNFSDFHLEDKDEAIQIRKNREIKDAVEALEEATRS
jgi:hypothetical protein